MIDSACLPVADDVRALRALAPRDAARYASGTQDQLVKEFCHLPERDYTPDSVGQMARTVVPEGLKKGDLAILSIVNDGDTFVGSLVLFDATDTSAEVGFWIHPDARGQGHAAGALELAVRLARDSNLTSLTARTMAKNVASQRNLERAGFEFLGRWTARTPSNQELPALHYRRYLAAE